MYHVYRTIYICRTIRTIYHVYRTIYICRTIRTMYHVYRTVYILVGLLGLYTMCIGLDISVLSNAPHIENTDSASPPFKYIKIMFNTIIVYFQYNISLSLHLIFCTYGL